MTMRLPMRTEAEIRTMIEAYDRTLAVPSEPISIDDDPYDTFKNMAGRAVMMTHRELLAWVLQEARPEINAALRDTVIDAKDLPPTK